MYIYIRHQVINNVQASQMNGYWRAVKSRITNSSIYAHVLWKALCGSDPAGAVITDSMLRRLLQGQARLVQRPLLSGGRRLCSRGNPLVRHRDGRLHQGAHPKKAHPCKRSRHTRLSVIFFVHVSFSFVPYRLLRYLNLCILTRTFVVWHHCIHLSPLYCMLLHFVTF